jgi:uncharacterized membrane protein YfcA
MIALVAALAFAIEASIGFGSTVFAATLGVAFVPLAQLIPAFVPVNLALSTILVARGRPDWRVLAREIAPPVAAGMALGLLLPGARLQLVFAIFVIALSLLQLARLRVWPRPVRIALLFLGGVAHGLFGTGGPLVVSATRGRLADPRATYAVLWLVLNVALLASFSHVDLRLSAEIALGLPIGLWVGHRLHRKLDERVVWIVLLACGCMLAR